MKAMDTPVAVWYTGLVLKRVGFSKSEVETYRAVYVQAYEGRASERMLAARDHSIAIDMALEDAEIDLKP